MREMILRSRRTHRTFPSQTLSQSSKEKEVEEEEENKEKKMKIGIFVGSQTGTYTLDPRFAR